MIMTQNEHIPGATMFVAAFVGDVSAPDQEERILVTEDDSYQVEAGHVFDVKDAGGWKTYYAAVDTEVFGPAIMTAPRKNEPSGGIFRESRERKILLILLSVFLILVSVICIINTIDRSLIVFFTFVIVASAVNASLQMTSEHATAKEGKLIKENFIREVHLSPGEIAYIRSKSQQE